MKKLLFTLSLLCALNLGAQKVSDVVIVEVTALTQYLSKDEKDKTPQHLAFSKSFAESERGRDLLQRLDLCIQRAGNALMNKGAKKAKDTFKNNSATDDEVDKMYDIYLKDIEDAYKNKAIDETEYKRRVKQNESMRAELKKKMRGLQASWAEMAEKIEGITGGDNSEMPEDPQRLMHELKRIAIGSKTWHYIQDLGRGTVAVTDKEGYEHYWGVMNILDTKIFPEEYNVHSFSAERNLIVLEKENKQRGLYRYNGECIVPFNSKEMWLDAIMNYPIVVTPNGYQALDENGKVLFTYPEIYGESGQWVVKGKDKKWGVVAQDGSIRIPLKYLKIFPATGDDGTRYLGGFTTPGSDDMDLYDMTTWQMVGKRVNGKIKLMKQ